MNNAQLPVQFFLQLAAILLFCRLVGAIALRLGQPQVVAEMVAGVLLGPSLFGLLWPEAQHWLFPWDTAQKMRDTQSYLFPASQLGLALYMFVVGMEFRIDIVRRKLTSSIAVSVAGMLTPFVLGAGLLGFCMTTRRYFQGRLRLRRRCFFLARPCVSPPFPCSRGSFISNNLPAQPWGRWRWAPGQLKPRARQHRRRRRLRGLNATSRAAIAASC